MENTNGQSARDSDGLRLADALEQLRAEFAVAQADAAGHEVQFPIESLTVVLQVAVTKSSEGKAGFKVPFVNAELGASGSLGRETLQTVTITLGAPMDRHGRQIKVAASTDETKG
jgi:hypothetical protein